MSRRFATMERRLASCMTIRTGLTIVVYLIAGLGLISLRRVWLFYVLSEIGLWTCSFFYVATEIDLCAQLSR